LVPHLRPLHSRDQRTEKKLPLSSRPRRSRKRKLDRDVDSDQSPPDGHHETFSLSPQHVEHCQKYAKPEDVGVSEDKKLREEESDSKDEHY
ncbi:hypothetical protein BHM03_00000260, partial [Ensete ventricosum]